MNAATVPLVPTFAQGLPRTYWFLLAGMFINRLGGFVVPLLTIYLTVHQHQSLQLAGLVVALYGAGHLTGSLIGGAMADHFGRRVTLLVSLVLTAFAMLALGVASSVTALAACGSVLGLTSSMYQPVTQTIISDVVPPPHRLRAYTMTYWAMNLGFSVALIVGSAIAERDFSWLFMADAATTLLFALVAYLTVPETKPPRDPGERRGTFVTPFTDLRFAPFLALCFLNSFVFFQHSTILPIDMVTRGLSTADFGLAIAWNGVLIVLLQPFASRLVARGARAHWLALSGLLMGLGFGATALASSFGAFVGTITVWTLSEILMAPLNMSVVTDVAPQSMRGRYQGAFGLSWSLANVAAPAVSPFIVAQTSSAALWGVCLAIGVLVAVGHLVFTSRVTSAEPLREAVNS